MTNEELQILLPLAAKACGLNPEPVEFRNSRVGNFKLVEHKKSFVLIVYPNPEPLTPNRNFAISLSKDYGETLVLYHAESLTACLDAAIAAQEKP